MAASAHVNSNSSSHNLNQRIEKLYAKGGYSARYGQDVWLTIVLMISAVFTTIYFCIKSQLAPIKANWPKYRCNPLFFPFAGLIASSPHENAFEYTGKNFDYCTQNILTTISGYAIAPFYYILSVMHSTVNESRNDIDSIRKEFAKIRKSVANVTENVVTRILNSVTALLMVIITSNTVLRKTAGIIGTALYTLMGAFMSINSIFKIVIDATLVGLILLAALIIPLWEIPFAGPPLAIIDTAIFVMILVVFLILKAFLADVMSIASGNAPPVPACFAGSTMLLLASGEKVEIKNILVGDILCDGSIVTGWMKMSSRDQEVYDIDGVRVTGKHRIFSPGTGLILAATHPRAVRIEDFREQYVYCINTSSKRLIIGGELYVDWDDLDPMDMYELDIRCSANGLLPNQLRGEDVHEYLESGIAQGSMIELDDGRSVDICDVEVNDVLRFGETVLGIVELDGEEVSDIRLRHIDSERKLVCTANVLIIDHELGAVNSHRISSPEVIACKKLYHLVTDSGSFIVNGIRVGDYNVGLEQHLRSPAFLSR